MAKFSLIFAPALPIITPNSTKHVSLIAKCVQGESPNTLMMDCLFGGNSNGVGLNDIGGSWFQKEYGLLRQGTTHFGDVRAVIRANSNYFFPKHMKCLHSHDANYRITRYYRVAKAAIALGGSWDPERFPGGIIAGLRLGNCHIRRIHSASIVWMFQWL